MAGAPAGYGIVLSYSRADGVAADQLRARLDQDAGLKSFLDRYALPGGKPWQPGTWRRINHHLPLDAREAMGREASPSAGVIDSQSAKTTAACGPRGCDAGRKVPTGPSLRAGSAARIGSTALPSMAASATS